ncbi:MAG: hypothetical protein V4487_05775 [Chlamydiota bacterium]
MRKLAWKLILLIIVGVIVFFWLIKAPIMSSYLTQKMGVPVSIGSISMWPSQTVIKNFRIKNPRGFKTRTAFEAERTEVDYNYKQLTSNPSEIDQILIDKIFISVEFSNPLGSQNNWTAIGAGMPKEERRNAKHVIIHKLILTNITIEIRGLGLLGKPQTRQIDRMEFDEIDSQKGFPTKDLISRIFKGAGIQQYIKDAFNPENIIDKVLNPFKGFGGMNEAVSPQSKDSL